ncbi:MAG: hypothetical protein J5874_01770 [Oscillospiraceae bacterium]|nr:hypothetical protein [Oscillospiraceae bacterium]
MNYTKTCAYIKSLSKSGSKPGLERIKKLLELIGNPQKRLKFVHVAGTNGKGSVTSMIFASLTKAGFKCGAFLSPYVNDVRECIKISGKKTSQKDTSAAFSYVKKFAEIMERSDEAPTEYEVITAAVLYLFDKENCDIVCLEACMGGLLDVTNVSESTLVSVITQIDIDHTYYLGNTIEKITRHKCGILRFDSICVSYPYQNPKALKIIESECKRLSCDLVIPDRKDVKILSAGLYRKFTYKNIDFSLSMPGEIHIYNAITAAEALFSLRSLGYSIPDSAVSSGISSTKLEARLEIIYNKPIVMLDGAHNFSGISALCSVLDELKCKNKRVIIGMLCDKEHEKCINLVAKHCSKIYTVSPKSPRALPGETLAAEINESCSVESFVTLDGAFDAAVSDLKKDEALIICGSFYVSMILREKAINFFAGGMF